MRNRWQYFSPLLDYLGLLLWVSGLIMIVPIAMHAYFAIRGFTEVPIHTFILPALLSIGGGAWLKRDYESPPIDDRQAMMLCALGWIVVSAFGALPFCLGIKMSFIDAYFETVSGFTTTGITMLGGLDKLPFSILFWRAFIQWLGGLGILTFFLAVLYTGGSAHRLFSAESHKVFSKRPAPSIFRTLRILWLIYAAYTVIITLLLVLQGMSLFDSACHSMTALSTGGYSPHDLSIAYYSTHPEQFPYYIWMEYTLILGMVLGGMNFFVHFRLISEGISALWDNLEMKLFWFIVVGSTALIFFERLLKPTELDLHTLFRASLFQVTSILTTTGFGTEDIAANGLYPAASRQILLLLMVIGGCVGSTGGGIKVLRVGVLCKMLHRQVKRLIWGHRAVHPVVVDGEPIPDEELHRISALFFAWMGLLTIGSLVSALLSPHSAFASASGMFSALGNIGPCFIPTPDMALLHPLIKIVYTFGMLAGRLEILPLLLLFSPSTWK